MEKKPDEPEQRILLPFLKKEPEDVTNKPLPLMNEPTEVQDAVASTLATPFAQPIITASKSKAQKQREYRQRITACRTPAQAAAARKSKNERQRNNRLRQAANLAIARRRNSLETTTTSPSRSGEESNNVQTRSQRQHAQQQFTTTADQPDERFNFTNEPLFPGIPVPMKVQEAVALCCSATLFAEPTTAAPKTRAQIQREYRQRIAASKTPAQAAAAREARNVRDRNHRLRQAANLVIASGSLEATTTSSSCSGQRLNTVHIDTQRQFTDQQRQTLATDDIETITGNGETVTGNVETVTGNVETITGDIDISWPQPIQVAKSTSLQIENSINVEVKQEILSEDEKGAQMEQDWEPMMDIKIEPEEIMAPVLQPTIAVNGVAGSEDDSNSNGVAEYLDSAIKQEPLSGDEQPEEARDLPLDCMLCSKEFHSVSGLKV